VLNFRNLEFMYHVTSIAMIFCSNVQNFTEIAQLTAKLSPKRF